MALHKNWGNDFDFQMKTKILGVIASGRPNSLTRHAVTVVLKHAESLGAEVQVLDLLATPLPLFNPANRVNEEYEKALKLVTWANAFVLGSPDYHGSMSGSMKNFLDYFWKEFSGKLFGYICASHEKGLTAMDHMRTAIRQCYGWSLPYGASVTDGDFDLESGKSLNSRAKGRLELMAYDLATYASILRKQFETDVGTKNGAGFASLVSKD